MTTGGGPERGIVPINPRHFDNAQRARSLSQEAREVLDRPENTKAIALSHGVDSDKLNRNPFFLLVLADNTPSVEDLTIHTSAGIKTGTEITREAVNGILDGVRVKSRNPDSVYVSVQVMNPMDEDPFDIFRTRRIRSSAEFSQESHINVVIYPYRPLRDAIKLDTENFRIARGLTPLYDRVGQVLGSPLYETSAASAYMKGDARSATLLLSDGADNASRINSDKDVSNIITDLVNRQHIVAAIAIGEQAARAFIRMGVPRKWIFTTDANGIQGAVDLFTEGVAQATNATREELLMLTDGGFQRLQKRP